MSNNCSYIYNPVPSRVWSRVQNSCTYIIPDSNYSSAFIPLTNQTVSQAQADYENKLQYKGNILQYKANSARLTKSQKYSQLAKCCGPNRTKVFATQSETYSNPNTTGLLKVGYNTYSYPNQIVGEPNNISGPFAYGIPNPNNCPGTDIQVGGTLVCGTYANSCSGQIKQKSSTSATICNPSSASNVPGTSILCWNSKMQSWFPKSRYSMNNSTDKWPVNYKLLKSALTPSSSTPLKLYLELINGYIYLYWTTNSIFQLDQFIINVNNGDMTFDINKNNTFSHSFNLNLLLQQIKQLQKSEPEPEPLTKTLTNNSLNTNFIYKDNTLSKTIISDKIHFKIAYIIDNSISQYSNTVTYNSDDYIIPIINFIPPITNDNCGSLTLNDINKLLTNKLKPLNDSITNLETNINLMIEPISLLATLNDSIATLTTIFNKFVTNCCEDNTSSSGCDCKMYESLLSSDVITQVNAYVQSYVATITDTTTYTYISIDEFTTLNVGLSCLEELIDPSCCFINLIDMFRNMLFVVKSGFDNKILVKGTIAASETWHQDSITLRDNTLLIEYLNKLKNSATILSFSVTAPIIELKPQYTEYHNLYGIPPNLAYDQVLMKPILESLNLC